MDQNRDSCQFSSVNPCIKSLSVHFGGTVRTAVVFLGSIGKEVYHLAGSYGNLWSYST
jgi:hypothetical protein